MSEGLRDKPALDLRWQWLILLALLGAIVYLLSPVLMPFVIAALFAYLADPMVDRLERWMGRGLAVGLVFLVVTIVVTGILLVLVPFIEHQVDNFLKQLPIWIDWFQNRATPWLSNALRRIAGSARYAQDHRYPADALEGSGRLRGDRVGASVQVRHGHHRLGAQPGSGPGRRVLSAARLGHPDRAHPHDDPARRRAGRVAPRARVGRGARRIRARPAQRDDRARHLLRCRFLAGRPQCRPADRHGRRTDQLRAVPRRDHRVGDGRDRGARAVPGLVPRAARASAYSRSARFSKAMCWCRAWSAKRSACIRSR